jgi:N-acetylglucosamine-6-phosphate deacetylase
VKNNNIILVSDSTMFAGMDAGVYESHIGGKVKLEKGGRLSTYKNENVLAGSAVSLLDCINKLFSIKLLSLSKAWSLASIEPKKLVNILDDNNDFVLFKLKNNSITILSVFKSGKQVFTDSEKLHRTI